MDTDSICAALTAAAARLDTHGEVLRGRVGPIARRRDTMRWHSPAARACRGQVDAVVRALLATSARLTRAGDDLRRCSARLANPP